MMRAAAPACAPARRHLRPRGACRTGPIVALAALLAARAWSVGAAPDERANPRAPTSNTGAAIQGPAPDALARDWDEHHVSPPLAPLVTHADVTARVEAVVRQTPELFSSEIVGLSVERRPIHYVRFGRGPAHVLLWSQMHGDEPTATSAIFDLFDWIRRERASAAGRRLLDALTVHVVPMLNPDGAQAFRRRNAQGIDVNRDALRLQSPEGRALKALRDRLDPVVAFNLHNQSWATSVGNPPRPASISLLAVAHDETRSDNPRRILAKRTAAVVREAVEAFVPGQVGRYSDEFEVRAFGDNIARWGTGVVLIETGPIQGENPEPALVRLNFVAIVSALDALASGRVQHADPARYESLPENGSRLLHTLITGATIVSGTGVAPFGGDIGIGVSRQVVRGADGAATLRWSARIDDFGDLRVYGALNTIDATGLVAAPMRESLRHEGAEVALPDWRDSPGPTLGVGQPGAVVLLAPVPGQSGRYTVRRVVEP